jgi:hypothetical protein
MLTIGWGWQQRLLLHTAAHCPRCSPYLKPYHLCRLLAGPRLDGFCALLPARSVLSTADGPDWMGDVHFCLLHNLY